LPHLKVARTVPASFNAAKGLYPHYSLQKLRRFCVDVMCLESEQLLHFVALLALRRMSPRPCLPWKWRKYVQMLGVAAICPDGADPCDFRQVMTCRFTGGSGDLSGQAFC
jgi:hypothetical protein